MRALLPAVLLCLPLVLPLAWGAPHLAELDLGETVQAGEFRAYRVRLLEEAQVEVGGAYDSPGTGTNHSVLPLMAVLHTADGWDMKVYLGADATMFRQPAGYNVLLRSPVMDQATGTPQTNYVVGGGWTTYTLPPGESVLLVATAASHGSANLRIQVLGPAEVLASQRGQAFYERGIDHSAVAFDVQAQAAAGAVQGRAWGYSGADLPLQVQHRLYAYVGYHQGTAHWTSPGGMGFFSGLVDEPGGAWTASFPGEEFLGPACALARCVPGDAREDPPFAIGADVDV